MPRRSCDAPLAGSDISCRQILDIGPQAGRCDQRARAGFPGIEKPGADQFIKPRCSAADHAFGIVNSVCEGFDIHRLSPMQVCTGANVTMLTYVVIWSFLLFSAAFFSITRLTAASALSFNPRALNTSDASVKNSPPVFEPRTIRVGSCPVILSYSW